MENLIPQVTPPACATCHCHAPLDGFTNCETCLRLAMTPEPMSAAQVAKNTVDATNRAIALRSGKCGVCKKRKVRPGKDRHGMSFRSCQPCCDARGGKFKR